MADEKPLIIRVTQTVDYMIDPKILKANGWTVEQLMVDWFRDINAHHATRDAFYLGGSRRFLSAEPVE